MKLLRNVLAVTLTVVGLTTLVKLTSAKFDENYSSPERQRTYPRLAKLPSIKLGEPSIGTKSPIVRLFQADGMALCSGVVISSNYILTAAHCLLDDEGHLEKGPILVKSDDKQITVKAIPASAYSRSDVGVITGDFKDFKIASVITDPKVIMNLPGPFVSCGFPYGGDLLCTQVNPMGIQNFMLIGDGILFPGQSGGPVISQLFGFVLAVNSAVSGNIAIYAPTIELFTILGIEVIK